MRAIGTLEHKYASNQRDAEKLSTSRYQYQYPLWQALKRKHCRVPIRLAVELHLDGALGLGTSSLDA